MFAHRYIVIYRGPGRSVISRDEGGSERVMMYTAIAPWLNRSFSVFLHGNSLRYTVLNDALNGGARINFPAFQTFSPRLSFPSWNTTESSMYAN